jgi:hypothetical protein
MTDYPLTVARLLQRERPDLGDLAGWPAPWAELARAGLQALEQGEDPRPAIEGAIERHDGDRQGPRRQLYAAAGRLLRGEPAAPPLPAGVGLSAEQAAGAGQMVDQYVAYAETISPMTPRLFHESAALWLGAVAIARRLVISTLFGPLFPNLFILWLAPTTLFRKSTALDVAHRLARQVFPHLMAAQDTTPEAFLSDLAGREPPYLDALTEADRADWQAGRNHAAQKGWLLDEMSGLMAIAGKDYNAGLVESLIRFYDCHECYIRSTRGQGRIVVRNGYLSLLGASTPAAMASHLRAATLWSTGWWPRFALLTPEAERPPWREPAAQDPPAGLVEGLEALYRRLPAPAWPAPPLAEPVTLGPGVQDAWNRYNKALSYEMLPGELDERLHGTYGRLPGQALKVALILAALDGWPVGQAGPAIELPHLARAISTCEAWRASAHRVLELLSQTDFDRTRVRIVRQIGRAGPEGATLRDIYRGMRDRTPGEIEDMLEQMVRAGEIEQESTRGQGPGRPTERYRLARE